MDIYIHMSNYKSYFYKSLGLREDSLPGGKGDETEPTQVDPEQLQMGIKVEMEHTHDPDLAKEIAMDHLSEDPHYYSHLKDAGLADELPGENNGETKPKLPMLQKLFSPTAIMPTPVIAVGVRGTKTGLLPAGGIVDDPEKARLGGLELVKNLKPNSQGAIANTPASDTIKADGGHYTPDNKEISKGKAPVTNVKGEDTIHPMQVQQLGNEPFKDDGTTRDGEHTPPAAGGEGDAPKPLCKNADSSVQTAADTQDFKPNKEPKEGPWGIDMDDEDEDEEEKGEVNIDIKEAIDPLTAGILGVGAGTMAYRAGKDLYKYLKSKKEKKPEDPKLKKAPPVKEGWAMGDYTQEQRRAWALLSKRGFVEVGTYPAESDAEGGNMGNQVVIVMQKRRGPFRVSGEIEPDGTVNGQRAEEFLAQNVEECGTMKSRFQQLANIPPTNEAGALSELEELVGRLNKKGKVTPLLAKAQKYLEERKKKH